MASLSASQRAIVRRIVQIGREVGASPKQIKAALETGRVESNFTNSPDMTDHDSQGWRQERASLYKDPTNLDHSIRRFFAETKAVKAQYGRAGDLAAAVQRPAAQYRGRYQGVSAEADALMRQFGAGGGAGGQVAATVGRSSGGGTTTTRTTTTPGVDNRAARAAAIQTFLGRSHQDPLAFALNIRDLQDVPGTSKTTRVSSGSPPSAPGAAGTPAPAGAGSAGGASSVTTPRSTPANLIDFNVLPLARSLGVQVTPASVKAANARHGPTVSGGRSDHQGNGRDTWAADMSNGSSPTPQMDKLAAAIAKAYHIPWSGSGLVTKVITNGGRKYRVQLIYRTMQGGNHYNHVHFGVEAM